MPASVSRHIVRTGKKSTMVIAVYENEELLNHAQVIAEEIWPEMKAAGAINMCIVKTDDTGARSMTMWPDESHAMRAKGAAKSDTEVVGSAMGTVLAEMN